MRKTTKFVVLTAALMLICAMTSFAVTKGWAQLDGQWVYYEDSDGNLATDVWKVSGGKNYYLGSDGYMLTNELVDDGTDIFYVGADGSRVISNWVLVPVEDDENGLDARWYYFGSNGKAAKDSTKKSERKDLSL